MDAHDPEAAVEPNVIANDLENLRDLLINLYVAVLGHLSYSSRLEGRDEAIDELLTTVLDEGEGRPFRELVLPWPSERTMTRQTGAC